MGTLRGLGKNICGIAMLNGGGIATGRFSLGECARNAHILNRAGGVDYGQKDGIEEGALNKGIDEMNGEGINGARVYFLDEVLVRATTYHGEE